MKSIVKLEKVVRSITIIAIAAVMGLTFAACQKKADQAVKEEEQNDDGLFITYVLGDGGGTFTLTGIPAEYNGKYAIFNCDDLSIIVGCGFTIIMHEVGPSIYDKRPIQIANGSVNLPMWIQIGHEAFVYTGNNIHSGRVTIYSESYPRGNRTFADVAITVRQFSSITFVNGSASKTWNDGR